MLLTLLTGFFLAFLLGRMIRIRKGYKILDAWDRDVGVKVSRFLRRLPKESDVRESFVRSLGFQYFNLEKHHGILFREGYYLAPFFILPYGSMKDFEILVVKEILEGEDPFDVGIRLTHKNEEWCSRVSEYMDLVLERSENVETDLLLFADITLKNLRIQKDLESFQKEIEHV